MEISINFKRKGYTPENAPVVKLKGEKVANRKAETFCIVTINGDTYESSVKRFHKDQDVKREGRKKALQKTISLIENKETRKLVWDKYNSK